MLETYFPNKQCNEYSKSNAKNSFSFEVEGAKVREGNKPAQISTSPTRVVFSMEPSCTSCYTTDEVLATE